MGRSGSTLTDAQKYALSSWQGDPISWPSAPEPSARTTAAAIIAGLLLSLCR